MEEVIDFWRRISKHYLEQDFDLISSQSTLHAGFFKSFSKNTLNHQRKPLTY